MTNALCLAYTAAYQDPISGGYPLGHGYRHYMPELMRFNAPDELSPFGAGGINGYAYCAGDPINRVDPSGHFHIGWQGWLGIGVAALGVGLAVFTDGGSLAAAGAVLGSFSAVSGVAAENTHGTAHKLLGGMSLASGIAGGVADAADMVVGAAAALQAVGRSARGIDLTAHEWQAVTVSGRIEGRAELPGVWSGRPGELGEPGPTSSIQGAAASSAFSRPRLGDFLRVADGEVADHPEEVVEHWMETGGYSAGTSIGVNRATANDQELRALRLHALARMFERHEAIYGERLLVTDLEGFPQWEGRPNMGEFFKMLGYPHNQLNTLRSHANLRGTEETKYVLYWLFGDRYV